MITLVNVLFILIPGLVYIEHQVNFSLLNQETNAVQEKYRLLKFIVDIGKVFTEGFVWMGITYVIVTKGEGDYSSFIAFSAILFLLFVACIPFYYVKLKNSAINVFFLLILKAISSTLSQILAMFFILVIMNYFLGLELYAFNI